jgi:hypothetical protein
MTEVFIEDQLLDITEGFANLITYAIDDIKDFGFRNTSFSKTIVLPGTANNNKQFGHIFNVTVSNSYNPALDNVGYNFNPSKQANCLIFQNHLQVFKGIIRVLKIIVVDGIPEYECAVFGELGGLVNSIGNAKLQDLDFSAYDHLYGWANASASWNNTPGSGYFYPLADYGLVSTNKIDYDIRALRPALYVKEYLDKIFADAGYSYASDLMDTTRFKSLVIPHSQKELTKNSIRWFDAEKADIGDYDIIESVSPTLNAKYLFTGIQTPVNFTITGPGPDYDTFTYTGPTGVTGRLVLNLHGDITNDGATIDYQIRINGTPVVTGTLDDTAGNTEEWQAIEDVQVTLTNGDVIDVYFSASGNTSNFNVGSDVGTFVFISDIPSQALISVGDTVQVNDTIPRNILQRDFLSSILKLFNLYAYEDPLKNKFINITPYVDFYNVTGIVDWNYKVDRSKPIELTPMSEVNARYYNFKFKQDSDYYNELYRNRYGEGYGDYLFDSEFAFSGEVTDIALIFSATPLVGYSGVDKIVSVYYKQSNGTEERRDNNIRIVQTKKITGVTSWSIKDGVTTLQSGLTSYGYGGHYDDPDAPSNDIQFGVPKELFFTLQAGAINVHQFNVYWSAYMAEITDKDSKLLAATFRLSNKDISELDFSKFIYLDGSYWRLNKIIDYNSASPDLCRCELLKVIHNAY